MFSASRDFIFSLSILLFLLLLTEPCSSSFLKIQNKLKSAVYLSPKFELTPGSVVNKYYYDIDFPRGHVAIKSFDAELVDEAGNSIPLHETYVHHWNIELNHQSNHFKPTENDGQKIPHSSDYVLVRNSGICQGDIIPIYFGAGSETRGTTNYIPDPFGIEIGNPEKVPEGFKESWRLNVHAIDTRGVVDKKGCTECWCELYNVTVDEYGKPLESGYKGGVYCCYDNTQCKLKEGFEGPKRSLYLKYTVTWVDWDDSIVPVKIYVLDVTDFLSLTDDNSKGKNMNHNCQYEYPVESCNTYDKEKNGCVHVRKTNVPLQTGGYMIYAVAHQHISGLGSTLYGQDGRVICSSIPIYGNGNQAGNESGYIVGMSTCYPKPGSMKITDGEIITIESKYNNAKEHVGVMGLFHVYMAEQLPSEPFGHSTRSWLSKII